MPSLEPLQHHQTLGPAAAATPLVAAGRKAPEVANAPAVVPTPKAQMLPGTGVFIQTAPSRLGEPSGAGQVGDITLNFVDADVRAVLPRVLGDVLHLNYTIDPQVKANITIQTSRPLKRQDVLPALREALRASGLALVKTGHLYRLMPIEEVVHSGTLPVTVGPNMAPTYNVQIFPLKYVSASEMEHTLEPYLPKGATMEFDAARNLLIVSGAGVDLSTITAMVRDFDVDWIKGMSFAIVPLQTASPKDMTDQMRGIFGPKGSVPLPGMLHFEPLDRMNAVLVVSPQRSYVEEAKTWIERLDRGENENKPRIYEYHVQNSRAADIAKVLTKLFSNGEVSAVGPQTAPGTNETQIGSMGIGASRLGTASLESPGNTASSGLSSSPTSTLLTSAPGLGNAPSSSNNNTKESNAANEQSASASATNASGSAETGGQGGASSSNGLSLPPVRIVADEKDNTLVIYAAPRTYQMIRDALKKIDVAPPQVLVEATIAEVTLNNELQYGLQYFFHQHENQFIFGSGNSPITGAPIPGTFPGFNYILGSANANVVLNLLSSITNVHVVSSPELLVLDHQTASLLVGSEIPIPTAQIQSTVASGAPIVNTIQYVDVGVILKVTPQVNANGLITLKIGQEVSGVASNSPTTSTLGPTITQRRIDSTITVQDGETVALGGLIQDTNSLSRNGLPILSDMPVLGPLFRSTDRTHQRTELLVLLSPRVLHDAADARAATSELRQRLHALQQGLPKTF